MLEVDPIKRPSIENILASEWLNLLPTVFLVFQYLLFFDKLKGPINFNFKFKFLAIEIVECIPHQKGFS